MRKFSAQRPVRRRPPGRRGFALIVALSLMSLVVLLLVILTSAVRLEMQAANAQGEAARARLNALLGAAVGLGELQRQAGPDQRATATTDYAFGRGVLPGLPGAGSTVGQKHWTEVWQPVRAANGGLLPDFRAWLVSHEPGSPVGPVFANGGGLADGNVWMVDRAVDPDRDGSNVDEKVQVPLVEISDAAGSAAGAYAFWVSDESVKASLDLVENGASAALPPSAAAYASRFMGRDGLFFDDFADGTEGLLDGADPGSALIGNLPRVESIGGLAFLDPAWDETYRADRNLFHELAPFSMGVLSDSVRGGLRKDLTAYFADDSSVTPGAALPDAPPYAVDDGDSIIPIAEWGLADNANLPAFGLLRDWVNLGRDLSGFEGGTAPSAQAGSDRTALLAPVLASVGLLFDLSFEVTEDAGPPPTQSDQIYLLVHPKVVFWNPYDAPIQGGTFVVEIQADAGDSFGDLGIRDLEDYGNQENLSAFGFRDVVPNGIIRLRVDLPDMRPGENIVCTLENKQKANGGVGTEYELTDIVLEDNFVAYPISGLTYDSTGWGSAMRDLMRLRERDFGTAKQTYLFATANPIEDFRFAATLEDSGGNELMRIDDPKAVVPAGRFVSAGSELRIKAVPELNDLISGNLGDSVSRPNGVTRSKFDFWQATNDRRQNGPEMALRVVIGGESSVNFSLQNAAHSFGSYSSRVSRIRRSPEDRGDPTAPGDLDDQHYPSVQTTAYGSGSVTRAFDWDSAQTNAYGSDSDSETFVFSGSAAWGHGEIYVFHSIPRGDAPLISLGTLSSAPLSRLAWQPAVALGNSRADARINRDSLFGYWNNGSNNANEFIDLSYLLNDRLFDGFFLSTIEQSPASTSLSAIDSGKGAPAADVRLPSGRMRFIPSADGTWPEADEVRDGDGAAAHLMVEGAFNVNSTSAKAWAALLAGARDRIVETNSGVDAGADGRTIIPRTLYPFENDRQGEPLSGGSSEEAAAGLRSLTDAEITSLAEAIAAENRRRMYETLGGPYPSIGAFVNRQVTGGEDGLKGALQAAIDATGINAHFFEYFTPGGSETGKGAHFEAGDLWSGTDLPLPEHVSGAPTGEEVSRAYGIPSYLEQAELLEFIAPALTARGDTFRVRAFGESAGEGSEQGAYLELLVQRAPGYLDRTSDEPETRPYADPADWENLAPDNLAGAVNARFGRAFRVVDARWLFEDEV